MFPRFLKPRPAGLLLAWVAALLIVAWLVLAGRHVAIDRAQRSEEAFAAVVEQQAERTFQAIYLTLGAIADAQQGSPRPRRNDRAFQEMMTRRLKDVPFVRAIFIIGRDGWIIHDTDYPRTPAVSLADRPYFRAYQLDPELGDTVWPPILSRSGTGWFLPVTRALGRTGEFEGVVVAALQAQHFEAQFREVGLPEGYVVSLFHRDGTLVARHPAVGEIGKSYASLSIFGRMAKESSGSFWTTDGLVRGNRLVSYRAVVGTPYVVRVSRDEGDMLAEWRRTAAAAGLAMTALTVFLGWFIVRLARESMRRARERERRVQAEKLEALGRLSSGMAHDFMNVLNVVGINVELLRARSGDPSAAQNALAALDRAVHSGRRVTERLLAFARQRPLSLSRVRLDKALESAHPLLAQAAGPGVTLSVASDAPLPEVFCDVGELDVALLNLVVNARDAMAGSGRIGLRAFPSAEEASGPKALVAGPVQFVCLTVRDNGPGMTEEVRRRALEPFYSTKGEAGTGLGLSQVYGFMRQLGGRMTIDSAPGEGTAVNLFFPVAPSESGSNFQGRRQ